MDDFYFDDEFEDEFDDDFEPQKSFSDILFELERNGTILRQWDEGAPIVDGDNAPKTETKTKKEL